MFSGIIEATSSVLDSNQSGSILTIVVNKPESFDDINLGDSVAVNGVCLTVEAYDEKTVQFTLALETLQVTGWSAIELAESRLNLERSLRLGDRIHGHMVAGHVDAMGEVLLSENSSGSWLLKVRYPQSLQPMIWKKGSITVNGVSLTVNRVDASSFSVCLIPETLKRTNLGDLKPGAKVTLEADTMARAVRRYFETMGAEALKGEWQ